MTIKSETQTDPRDGAQESTPENTPRLRRPAGQFGLRMAVLAGVIVASGGTTTGLGSAVNTVAGPADTTCCGGSNSSISRTV
ncbi:hypothetical protein [Actinomadura sp. DC4]|uniref:hypothetical protein n=1 Tax=Actinomadura sp. DC4 TaxID=3055069 RepID=UPI0025AED726|nr:hypothetical protein [Actinomadura sp. DC4]MDN3356446.1 hypothetical protein [Actinomadura sp. DC4]